MFSGLQKGIRSVWCRKRASFLICQWSTIAARHIPPLHTAPGQLYQVLRLGINYSIPCSIRFAVVMFCCSSLILKSHREGLGMRLQCYRSCRSSNCWRKKGGIWFFGCCHCFPMHAVCSFYSCPQGISSRPSIEFNIGTILRSLSPYLPGPHEMTWFCSAHFPVRIGLLLGSSEWGKGPQFK